MNACKTAAVLWLAGGILSWLAGQEAVPERLFVSLNAPTPTAQVRALAFTAAGDRLCTGGLDKLIQVLPLPGGPPGGTLRWAIERGDYGTIYALAREGRSDVLAVAGKGWSGGMGEIVWLDLNTGKQVAFEGDGHRQVVASLASSADGRVLISADVSGRVLARVERQAPLIELQPAGAKLFSHMPVAIAGNIAVVPSPLGAECELRWFDLTKLAPGARPAGALPKRVAQFCTALTANADGSLLAAADATGRIFVWNLRGQDPPREFQFPGVTMLTLALHPTEPALVFGGQVANPADSRNHTGALGVINLTSGKVSRENHPVPILNVAFDSIGKRFAYVTLRQNVVAVCDYAPEFAADGLRQTPLARGVELQSPGIIPVKAEGAAELMGIVVQPRNAAARVLTLDRFELLPAALPAAAPAAGTLRDAGPGAAEYSAPGGVYPLRWNAGLHGRLVHHALVPFGGRSALAVATEFSRQIWLYELPPGRPPILLRQFWGHAGLINGITVATVNKNEYLVSTAADGTTRVWPLSSATNPDPVLRRWGVVLEVADGKAKIAALDPNGPLAARLMEVGDTIEKLEWYDAGANGARTKFQELDPKLISARLTNAPPGTQVVFYTARGGVPRPVFQNVDAFQHLLALYVRENEWIAWHPSGYYACSTNGENLIGWQLNGPKKGDSPEYFLGEQFAARFHQPALIRELLFKGNLTVAAAQFPTNPALATEMQAKQPPLQLSEVLPPKVELILPSNVSPEELEKGINVKVKVVSRTAEPVESVQLSVNGRPGPEIDVNQREAEITVPLRRTGADAIRVEALASTASTLGKSPAQTRKFPGVGRGSRVLHVLAVGVSEYKVQKLKLNFAHRDAERIHASFERHFAKNEVRKDLFDDINCRLLKNEQATKANVLRELNGMIQTMGANDAAVVFLAGHGFDDKPRPAGNMIAVGTRGTNLREETYLYAPVDVVEGKEFDTCVSDEEIGQAFWKAQGQVLLVLDTCRSGSFQFGKSLTTDVGLRLNRAKFGIQVFAATEKGQDAHENPKTQSGMFTQVLLDGIEGAAMDLNRDQVINTFELQAHLTSNLATESERILGRRQEFTSSRPPEFRDFPLTLARNKVAGNPPPPTGN